MTDQIFHFSNSKFYQNNTNTDRNNTDNANSSSSSSSSSNNNKNNKNILKNESVNNNTVLCHGDPLESSLQRISNSLTTTTTATATASFEASHRTSRHSTKSTGTTTHSKMLSVDSNSSKQQVINHETTIATTEHSEISSVDMKTFSKRQRNDNQISMFTICKTSDLPLHLENGEKYSYTQIEGRHSPYLQRIRKDSTSIPTTTATHSGILYVDRISGNSERHKDVGTPHKGDDRSQQMHLCLSTSTESLQVPPPPPPYKSLVNHFILDGPPTYKVVITGDGKHPKKVG